MHTILSEVLEGLRLGRMTVFRKPDGGVRGIGRHLPQAGGSHCREQIALQHQKQGASVWRTSS